MPVTKKSTGKTAVKKKASARTTKKFMKGDKYVCNVCGLAVSIDTACDCIDTCDILCCNMPMKLKKKATQKK